MVRSRVGAPAGIGFLRTRSGFRGIMLGAPASAMVSVSCRGNWRRRVRALILDYLFLEYLDPGKPGQDLAVDERRVITGATQSGQDHLARSRDIFSRFFSRTAGGYARGNSRGGANLSLSASERRDVNETACTGQDRFESAASWARS
jgi:hypothetical protein